MTSLGDSAIMARVRTWQIAELVLLLVPGILLLWRIRLCGDAETARPDGRATAPSRVPAPSRATFTVVIPARNEALRIAPLLSTLGAQTVRPNEVIVVDDGSTDATAGMAAGAGCRVIPAPMRPPGWLGKTWASWTGAREATGELLLFLDADTRLDPRGCERILRERARYGGVITLQPWHQTGSFRERLSSFFNVVVMAAINTFTAFGDALAPAGCFGPCILCAREEYFRAGGHEAVKGSILEDVDLGRRFLASGIPVRCLGGEGVIVFRMYPGGLGAIVEGWSKNIARGAQGSHPLVLACMVLWISGCFSAAVFAARWGLSGSAAAAAESALLYLLYAAEVLWMVRRVGNFGVLTALSYPAHLLFFVFVFARSLFLTLIVRAVTWSGRRIARPTRAG